MRTFDRHGAVWLFGFALWHASTVLADDDVPAAYRLTAARYDIPADVFYAVALSESGRRIDALDLRRPWPWTLNIAGQGTFYPTRAAAWRALEDALAHGETRIDIGLMQINWRFHRQRLGNTWLALAPLHNLRVGAEILQQCHTTTGDWWASVGCYHAPNNAERATRYAGRVRRIWRTVTADMQ